MKKIGFICLTFLLIVACKKAKQEGVYKGTYSYERYDIGVLVEDTNYVKSINFQRNGERFQIDSRNFESALYKLEIETDDHHTYKSNGEEESHEIKIVGDSLYYLTHVQSLGFTTRTSFSGVKAD